MHIYHAIHQVSIIVGRYVKTSHTVTFLGLFPNGICHNHQHDRLCMCAILGIVGYNTCLGDVVDRCSFFNDHQLLFTVRNVHITQSTSLVFAMQGKTRVSAHLTNSCSDSMKFHINTELSTMTAAWLLPIVPTVVASASGSIVAGILHTPQHALWTLTVSYVLWGTGVPLAMAILVIYFERLAVHKLPPREVVTSVFLPMGPLGQGGFAIMQLGKVCQKLFPRTNTLSPLAGEVLYVVGFLIALIMWGFGLVWFFFALATISQSAFPFNMGWWGFTFPIGVFALSTVTFGNEMSSMFFKVLGTVLSIGVVFLWIIVATSTAWKSYTGELFHTPLRNEAKKKDLESTNVALD